MQLACSVFDDPAASPLFVIPHATGTVFGRLSHSVHQALAARSAIEYAVSRVFGVSLCAIQSATRGQAKAANARQVAMYLAHISCGLTLTETGRAFQRDRTTVAHACSVVEDRRDDPSFDRTLDLLEWAVSSLAERTN